MTANNNPMITNPHSGDLFENHWFKDSTFGYQIVTAFDPNIKKYIHIYCMIEMVTEIYYIVLYSEGYFRTLSSLITEMNRLFGTSFPVTDEVN